MLINSFNKSLRGAPRPTHPLLAHKFCLVLVPLNHSFIGSLTPPLFKELDPPLQLVTICSKT